MALVLENNIYNLIYNLLVNLTLYYRPSNTCLGNLAVNPIYYGQNVGPDM